MSRNRIPLVQNNAATALQPAAKWVASAEEVSQYLPSLTKGQQACVLAHAQYQKIPDVAKETGYSVHTVRQWLKTDAVFYACWHGMGRHVLEQGRVLALNLARAAAPRAVLVACPPRTSPGVMLDLDKKGGSHGSATADGRGDHHQAAGSGGAPGAG